MCRSVWLQPIGGPPFWRMAHAASNATDVVLVADVDSAEGEGTSVTLEYGDAQPMLPLSF